MHDPRRVLLHCVTVIPLALALAWGAPAWASALDDPLSLPTQTRTMFEGTTLSERPAEEPHGAATGGGEFLPIVALAGAATVVGAALVGVLRLARERQRRDQADANTNVGTSSDDQ